MPRARIAFVLFLTVLASGTRLAFADPINPNDILVASTDSRNSRPAVWEYTTSGQLVQEFFVPSPPGSSASPIDMAVDGSGNVQIYDFNSFVSAILTTLTPTDGAGSATFQYHTMSGWNTRTFYSGIAYDDTRQALYANDMGSVPGIVRFDSRNYAASRPLTSGTTVYENVILGHDGLIYASYPTGSPGGTHLDVIDPSTFTVERTVVLPFFSHSGISGSYTGWAVDANGNIFAVEGETFGAISEFNPQGVLIKTLSIPFASPTNLDLSNDGRLMTIAGGDVVLTTTDLTSYTTFHVPTGFGGSTAWATPILVPELPSSGLLGIATVMGICLMSQHFCVRR